MKLLKFTILSTNETLQSEDKVSMLINIDHIISVKPIKMTTSDRQIIDGHWLRLTNGKKYKAIQVPIIIKDALKEELPQISLNADNLNEMNIQ